MAKYYLETVQHLLYDMAGEGENFLAKNVLAPYDIVAEKTN